MNVGIESAVWGAFQYSSPRSARRKPIPVPTSGNPLLVLGKMYQAGEQLIATFVEEKRLEALVFKFPENADFYNRWQRARRAVEEYQQQYDGMVRRGAR
jgi:hypothetical protein